MSKRICAIFTIVVLLLTCFTGCSGDTKQTDTMKQDDTTTKAAMGRYMEKEMELPELEEDESIITVLQNANKQFEVYTVSREKKEYYCYLWNADMTWEKTIPGWLNNAKQLKNNALYAVYLGEDGNYYACAVYYSPEYRCALIKAQNDDTAQSVDIPYLDEPKLINGTKCYPIPESMAILENGNIVFRDTTSTKSLLVFNNGNGEIADEIAIGIEESFHVIGNNIIFMNEENKIVYYNTETKSIDRSVEYNGNRKNIKYAQKADGTLIMADSDGIHRLAKDGTLWETTVDGALNSMNMPSLMIMRIFVTEGEPEEYYITYMSLNSEEISIKHYAYDKSVSAVPAKEITVYSLRENSTIRQAVSRFQTLNSDIKVNYVVAVGEQGGVISDYIRALNTELLSGNGADILVLDELPAAAYIEKGVLADINDIINPLEASSELFTNISNNYHVNGKVYQMPIRFFAPIIIGKENALRAYDSLSGIVDFLQKNKQPFTNQMTYRSLISDHLALNSELLYKNEQLQEEQLKSFLEGLKAIAKNTKASEECDERISKNNTYGNRRFFNGDVTEVGENCASALQKLYDLNSFVMPLAIVNQRDLSYDTIGQRFIPMGMIGLNKSSKEADLAKKFISFLYSQEIQSTNLYDGFPIIRSSLQKWFDVEKDGYFAFGYKGNIVNGVWPNKEERSELLNKILELKNPIEYDPILNDMIIEEALPYLKGDKDVNQAAKAILTKVNTYLAE